VRAIDPFHQVTEQEPKLKFLEDWLLFSLISSGPPVKGHPAYFALLYQFHCGQEIIQNAMDDIEEPHLASLIDARTIGEESSTDKAL